MPNTGRAWRLRCLRVLLSMLATSLLAAAAAHSDPRRGLSATSPDWLLAVGALDVPVQQPIEGRLVHLREDCSATLVTREGAGAANIIVTAWHCLEDYRDLSRPIMACTPTGQFSGLSGVSQRAPRSLSPCIPDAPSRPYR